MQLDAFGAGRRNPDHLRVFPFPDVLLQPLPPIERAITISSRELLRRASKHGGGHLAMLRATAETLFRHVARWKHTHTMYIPT
jgi:hypothetical protein